MQRLEETPFPGGPRLPRSGSASRRVIRAPRLPLQPRLPRPSRVPPAPSASCPRSAWSGPPARPLRPRRCPAASTARGPEASASGQALARSRQLSAWGVDAPRRQSSQTLRPSGCAGLPPPAKRRPQQPARSLYVAFAGAGEHQRMLKRGRKRGGASRHGRNAHPALTGARAGKVCSLRALEVTALGLFPKWLPGGPWGSVPIVLWP